MPLRASDNSQNPSRPYALQQTIALLATSEARFLSVTNRYRSLNSSVNKDRCASISGGVI